MSAYLRTAVLLTLAATFATPFATTTATAAGQQATGEAAELDAVIGTWQLDIARSQFDPGPAPQAEVRIYEPGHEGIKTIIRTQHADGRKTVAEFVASYNQVQAAVTGSSTVDAIEMKRIDDLTAEAVLRQGGMAVGTARRVVSRDGRTMTLTVTRTRPSRVTNVSVYRRLLTP